VFKNSQGHVEYLGGKACSEETELKVPELVGHSTLKPPQWAADAQGFLQTNHAPRAQENKQIEGARRSIRIVLSNCILFFTQMHLQPSPNAKLTRTNASQCHHTQCPSYLVNAYHVSSKQMFSLLAESDSCNSAGDSSSAVAGAAGHCYNSLNRCCCPTVQSSTVDFDTHPNLTYFQSGSSWSRFAISRTKLG
jgi:hypothetical protein